MDLKVLRTGSRGPQVKLLQLGLSRYGFALTTDGIFGQDTYDAVTAFQGQNDLVRDGIVGANTWRALMPWLTGYITYKVRRGDTIYRLAQRYNTTISLIEGANPDLNPYNLRVGSEITIPFDFDVVPTGIEFTSTVLELCVRGLTARYPFISHGSIGSSVMGKQLWYLKIGEGSKNLMFNASHHANEWITSPHVMA
ncbi:MAG: peptidoglycan-binding protein, partial [Oscillospiraceae bacterium]|nr:peptidoglycan-binding protein [Oscillospiraceae bacterium]